MLLPALMITMMFACLLLPRVQQNANLHATYLWVATGMAAWQVLLWWRAARGSVALLVQPVAPVPQHYVQACMQLCLYVYWGSYWQPIPDQALLIVSQVFFVLALDALFAWSRGRTWRLSSGPLPIVLSSNLFVWFVDDAFALQFAMIAAGLLGKEFLRWQKDGRRCHVFNPSGFGLLVTAIFLIATGTTDTLTWARPLATTIENPPHIYLFLFCLGLVVQGCFHVTLMTFAAAVTITALNLGYTWATGAYMFIGSNLPTAGFLGLMLLMTDPSTSPRTNLGRLLFGAGYGLGYVVMYDRLGALGDLELFAKLFPVPILNLTVRFLDRLAQTGATGRWNARWEAALPRARMNLVHMALWTATFLTMLGSGYLPGANAGNSILFWKRAFAEGKPQAERKLRIISKAEAEKQAGLPSGEAANEFAIAIRQSTHAHERADATGWFGRGTYFGSVHAARNLLIDVLWFDGKPLGDDLQLAVQRVQAEAAQAAGGGLDARLLARLAETGTGVPRDVGKALNLYRSCPATDLDATCGIVRIGLGPDGKFVDLAPLLPRLERGEQAGSAECCWYLAHLVASGRIGPADQARAKALFARACELGLARACAAKDATSPMPFAPLPIGECKAPAFSTALPL